MPEKRSTLPSARMWAVWISGGLVLVLVGLWVGRNAIAGHILRGYCERVELSCQADVTSLGLGQLVLENVNVGSHSNDQTLSADRVHVDYRWPQFLRPHAELVRIEQPLINLAHIGDLADSLPIELQNDNSHSAPLPRILVEAGQVFWTTPDANSEGDFNADIQWPSTGQLNLTLAPTLIKLETQDLDLSAFDLDLTLQNGTIEGALKAVLNQARLGSTTLSKAELQADIEALDLNQVRWTLTAARMAHNGILAENVRLNGRNQISTAEGLSLLQRISPFEVSASTGQLQTSIGSADGVELSASLEARNAVQNQVSAELSLDGLETSELEAETAILTYAGSLNADTLALAGNGTLQLADASRDPDWPISDTGDRTIDGFLAELKQAVQQAADSFNLRLNYRLDADSAEDWRLLVGDAISMDASSGARMSLAPSVEGPVLSIEPDTYSASGLFTVRGGGFPTLNADLHSLNWTGGDLTLRTGGARLSSWTVGETSVDARLNRLFLSRSGGDTQLSGAGEIGLNGPVQAINLSNAWLFGDVEARFGDTDLRVQTVGETCLGLNADGVSASGSVRLVDLALALCPDDGRLVQKTDLGLQGALTLGTLTLPFVGKTTSGQAVFEKAGIDWTISEEISVDIEADSLRLPMQIGQRHLNIHGDRPNVSMRLSEQSTLTAELGQTKLSGSLVPALVSSDSLTLDSEIKSGRFTGDVLASEVIIRDKRADPIFEPIRTDISAKLLNSRMTADGPLRLLSTYERIGDATLDIDLVTLTGEARATTLPLTFQPAGLQPDALSDRLRGFLSNAVGMLTADAAIDINKGKLSGTGHLNLTDLGFDTLRLGRISGVEGSIYFDDVLKLATPPDQRITIASMRPGLDLTDGEILFELRPGGEAALSSAIWPFAGGTLEIEPTVWTISGQSDLVTVRANEITLQGLVKLLTLPDIDAEGTLSGTFPISFEDGNVFIRDALLIADENGGVLRYTGESVQAASASDPTVNAAFEALRDFRFSVLELGVDGNLIGNIVLSLKLLGYNPEVLGGAPFQFNIKVDSQLAQLINSGREAVTTDWIARAVQGNSDPAE